MPSTPPITSSTAIMARLFCKMEGGGYMIASVPVHMTELGERLCMESEVGDQFGVTKDKKRATFAIRAEAVPYVLDLRSIPSGVLRRDQIQLQEMLARCLAFSSPNLVLPEEWQYLLECIGHGAWCRRLGRIGEME